MSNTASSPSAVVPFYFQAIGSFQSHQVRAMNIDGDPWFVAADVCAILEHTNVSVALSMLDEDERAKKSLGLLHDSQEINIISESGLYTLIIRSNKPQARAFRKWVTAEVLPAIRKTGAYIALAVADKFTIPQVPEAQSLKPGMRQRLWNDAMQAARLDSGNSEDARRWFAELCRMVAGGARTEAANEQALFWQEQNSLFAAFAKDHLADDADCAVPFIRLYHNFLVWYRAARPNANITPSKKALSAWLDGKGYIRRKPGGNATVYGLALVKEVAA